MNNYLKSTVLTLTAAAVLTGCTASSQQPAGTAAADAGVSGEFESTVKGRNADLTVRTIFENSVIIKVEVTDHQETSGVPAAIVENNSVAVDSVSGATITSEASDMLPPPKLTHRGGGFPARNTIVSGYPGLIRFPVPQGTLMVSL